MNKGWIKLRRSLVDWEWYGDHNATRLLIHLLCSVNYEDKKWKGINIKAGSMVLSWETLSKQVLLTKRQCRTAMEKLESSGEVTRNVTNKYQVVTLVKWEKFQIKDKQMTGKQSDGRQTDDRQMTTTKESKEYKEINNSYCKQDFLNDWNELRTKHLNKPSNINRLGGYDEDANFKELVKAYEQEDFRDAITGLFKQKYPPYGNESIRSSPGHLLKEFERYLTAHRDKNANLYGKYEVNT